MIKDDIKVVKLLPLLVKFFHYFFKIRLFKLLLPNINFVFLIVLEIHKAPNNCIKRSWLVLIRLDSYHCLRIIFLRNRGRSLSMSISMSSRLLIKVWLMWSIRLRHRLRRLRLKTMRLSWL